MGDLEGRLCRPPFFPERLLPSAASSITEASALTTAENRRTFRGRLGQLAGAESGPWRGARPTLSRRSSLAARHRAGRRSEGTARGSWRRSKHLRDVSEARRPKSATSHPFPAAHNLAAGRWEAPVGTFERPVRWKPDSSDISVNLRVAFMEETLLWWCFAIAVPSFFALSVIAFLVERSRRAALERQAADEMRERGPPTREITSAATDASNAP